MRSELPDLKKKKKTNMFYCYYLDSYPTTNCTIHEYSYATHAQWTYRKTILFYCCCLESYPTISCTYSTSQESMFSSLLFAVSVCQILKTGVIQTATKLYIQANCRPEWKIVHTETYRSSLWNKVGWPNKITVGRRTLTCSHVNYS